MINIPIIDNENKEFTQVVNKLIRAFLAEKQPREIYISKIKNWFDHKWLNFSGIGVVGFNGLKLSKDSALDEFWQDKITLPPFNPNRVIEQNYFLMKDGQYIETEIPEILHPWQFSSSNLNRRIVNYSNSGIFIWYSSNTKINQKGSLMVYFVLGEQVETFYLSLAKKEHWFISKAKGINKESLQIC